MWVGPLTGGRWRGRRVGWRGVCHIIRFRRCLGAFYLDDDHQVLIGATGTSEAGYVLFMNVRQALVDLTQTSFTRTIEIEGDTEERILSMHTATVLFEKMIVGEAPPPPPPPENLIDFATEIHPLFESLYCTNCHRANSPLPNIQLELDGAPEAVYEALFGGDVPRVDLNVPDDSLLLKKPLLEDPPDHPNAAFIATNDPAYVLIRSWIEQGAPAPSLWTRPSLRFAEDIMPIFQVGGTGRAAPVVTVERCPVVDWVSPVRRMRFMTNWWRAPCWISPRP